jgi:cysteine sulfinate desulfinase/cysteine desulfurase-like protein
LNFLQEEEGFQVTVVPVSADGFVNVDDIRAAIRPETCMITIMHANNEVGTIQPIAGKIIAFTVAKVVLSKLIPCLCRDCQVV